MSDILGSQHPLLATILKETERLKKLNARLSLVVDQGLLPYTRVACLNATTLTLVTDAALYATRLRYDSQQMMRKCKAIPEFCAVTQIDIKVQPKAVEPKKPVIRPEISPERQAWLAALVKTLKLSEVQIKK